MESTPTVAARPREAGQAFFLSDAEGRVEYCERAAGLLMQDLAPGASLEELITSAMSSGLLIERVADLPTASGPDRTLCRVRRADSNLSQSERRKLVEISPDLVLVVRDGRILFANRAGALMLGAGDAPDLAGRRLDEILSGPSAATITPALERLSREGASIPVLPVQFRTDSGGELEAELVGIAFEYHGAESALLIARNVTGHLAAHRALRESVTLLESTLDSTADSILVLDVASSVVYHNSRLATLLERTSQAEFVPRLLDLVTDPGRMARHVSITPDDSGADIREEIRFRDGRIVDLTSIPWRVDDQIVGRVLSFRDVSERRKSEEGLVRREQILQAVAFSAERFLTSDRDSSVDEVLGRLGQATQVSRVYMFQNHVGVHGEELWSQRHEWAAPGISPQITNEGLQNLPVAGMFDDWQEILASGTYVHELVREMASSRRELMESQNIRSMMLVPITLDHGLWGFLGFDDCTSERVWTSLEIDALRTASRILAGAIQKRSAQEALRRSEERYRSLFQNNLAGVYRNSLDGRILDCNDACARILGYHSREELLTADAHSVYFENAQREMIIDHLRRSGSLTNAELCLRRRDGRMVWVLENVTLRDEGGELVMEGTIIDITDRKRAEEALRESEERYRLMADSTTDIISRHTADGVFLYASPASRDLLGYEPHELVGRELSQFTHPDDAAELEQGMETLRTSPNDYVSRHRLRRRDGRWVWFETTSRMIRNLQSGDALEIICVSRDISERKRAEERIEHQAYHDALTGLPNRTLFGDRLSMAIARARRSQKLIAVIFLDLDFFKEINDTAGHAAGDRLLRDVATRLRSSIRAEDTVARMGGDEFLLLLVEIPTRDDVLTITEKILAAVEQPYELSGRRVQISASIGVALFPQDGEDPETLISNADRAMYEAKNSGRNAIRFFHTGEGPRH